MPQVTIAGSVSGGSVQVSNRVVRTADSVSGLEVPLPAGKLVTAWVKTDADTAGCNLPAGHGYTTGNFDVFWSESGVAKRRYKVPGTITVNALALDGGSGDAFPATAAADVVATKQVAVNVAIDGDALAVLAANLRYASGEGKGSIAFYDVGNALIAQVDLPQAPYDITGGNSNPFTGNPITNALATNGISTLAATLQIVVGQDSTP